MESSGFGRVLFTCVGAALLASCGGAGTPLSATPAAHLVATPATMMTHRSSSGTFAVLHSFGGAGDGTYPRSAPMLFENTLYGTTRNGGANDLGTVYEVTASGGETLLHSFGGSGDGAKVFAPLINVHGTIYGTTGYGGANNKGTVFEIPPFSAAKVLHSFGGPGDGVDPIGGLVDVDGTLYGTTAYGGASDKGTIFSITRSGTERVRHSFAGGAADGAVAFGGLTYFDGRLYGTTDGGGAQGKGTVYAFARSGVVTVLHSFGGSGDGEQPYFSNVVIIKGALFGTTRVGGAQGKGVVFCIPYFGAEKVIHSFGGAGDGVRPFGGLTNVDGTLYGTTSDGGTDDSGTIFAITPSGSETVLHSFSRSEGSSPYAPPTAAKGILYGTASAGGANDKGTLWALTLKR